MASQNANSNLHVYIQNINRLYVQGHAIEHSYRGDLAQLIEAIAPGLPQPSCDSLSNCILVQLLMLS